MSATYYLVNYSKKEIIYFLNFPVSTINEILINPVASAMVVYYLNVNKGHHIGFVNDYDDDMMLYHNFAEVTHKVIDEMIQKKILSELEPKKIWLDDEIWFWNLMVKHF